MSSSVTLGAPFDVSVGLAEGALVPTGWLDRSRGPRSPAIRATPAGALGAALLAAAEHGRERGGYAKLAALEAWWAAADRVPQLFAPTRAARPFWTFARSLERRRREDGTGSWLAGVIHRAWAMLPAWVRITFDVVPGALRDALPARYWTATVVGGVIGGSLDAILARGLVAASHPVLRTVVAIVLPVMFIGCYVASVGACAARLWRIVTSELPNQGYGACTGLGAAGEPALTDWLHAQLQDLAGLGADDLALTAEVQWLAEGGERASSVAALLATGALRFDDGDLRAAFPPAIVEYMRVHPGAAPLVVLARLHMRFPLALSAVAVRRVDANGVERREWMAGGERVRGFPFAMLAAWEMPRRGAPG